MLFCASGFSLQAECSADPSWEQWNSGLPSRAYIVDLETIPLKPGLVIAALYGMPGLWGSQDHGETWQEIESPISNHTVFTLCWDDSRQGLWVGTERGLHFGAWDGDLRQWSHEDEPGRPVLSLQQDGERCLYALVGGEGLFRRCGAEEWQLVLPESRPAAFAVSPTGKAIVVGTVENGLWISRDAGQKWEKAAPFQNTSVLSLFASHAREGLILAATEDSLWSSDDQGITWSRCDAGINTRIVTLAEAPDGTIFAGFTGGVAFSTDGGSQWSAVRTGLLSFSPVQAFAFMRLSAGGDRVLAGTREGIYHSEDQGRSWERIGQGLGFVEVNSVAMAKEGRMIAASSLGLFSREKDAAQWLPALPLPDQNAAYDLTVDGTGQVLYAGMEGQLARSQDAGHTWQKVPSELARYGLPGVLLMPDSSDHLLGRVTFERVYESFDGGRTWQERWDGMETSHIVLAMAQSPTGELWAGTSAGLFRWDPDAERWEDTSFPDSSQSIYVVACAPAPETGIFVGCTEGLWFSKDGIAWERRAERDIPYTITSIAFPAPGKVLAGTRYFGLYQSCDAGNTWRAVPGLPENMTVNDILVDHSSGRVFIATDRGLFFSDNRLCRSESGHSVQPKTVQTCASTEAVEPAWLKWLERNLGGHPSPVPAVHTLRPDDSILRAAEDIGFRAIVQVFSWSEIEPADDDWRWEYYDFLINAAQYYHLQVIARLDHPPPWALVEHPGAFECPFQEDAYIEFVERVVQRYGGRIQGYIIWNEPNLAGEWHGEPNPGAYARILRRAYITIKGVDPLATVVSAGLAPTNEVGPSAMDDRLYLAELYRWEAAPFFDALGAHPYGFAYSPDDPPGAHQELNYQRLLELREVMAAYEDGGKPIWATEVGWTTNGLEDHTWLTVTPQTQADYLVGAWEKARDAWPWLSLFTVWNLSSGVEETADEKSGYSILYPDGSPKPAYFALREAFSPWKITFQNRMLMLFPIPQLTQKPVNILREDISVHLGDSE